VDSISQTLDLDFELGPAIDKWLPGETLYSLGCRHHILAGNAKAEDTCMQLYGHRRIGSAHDLPGRVSHFVQRTKGQLGDAESCIREHTILPYYFPFKPIEEESNAITAMSGDSIGSLKAKLGILATRFGAAHPLKACPTCLQEDLKTHHIGYWHVEHQLPGVWLCPWHSDMLCIAENKWMGVDRFGWHLPTDNTLTPYVTGFNELQPDLDVLKRLADSSVALWSLPPGFHFSTEKVNKVLLDAMKAQGLSSDSGRIQLSAFGSAIIEFTHTLVGIRELSNLPSSIDQALSQFTRIIYGPRSSPHPLKYQILILVLFRTWATFMEKYNAEGTLSHNNLSAPPVPSSEGVEPSSQDKKRAEFLSLLTSTNASMNALANELNISVSTAMAWAASAGFAPSRRSKILTPDIRKKLIRILRKGIDKKIAAKAFSVSIQTITTTLRTEIGLNACWAQARFKRAQSEARDAWAETARNHPTPTPKSLRLMQPAVYAWLYRNDRAWLEQFNSQIGHAPKSNYANINWDTRDIVLAQTIKSAVLDWYEKTPNQHLTIARICQLVPGTRSRLSKLNHLPLTRAALSEISVKKRKHKH
jgi:hypothetical protein